MACWRSASKAANRSSAGRDNQYARSRLTALSVARRMTFCMMFDDSFVAAVAVAYMLRRYCPPTSNSAFVICPSE